MSRRTRRDGSDSDVIYRNRRPPFLLMIAIGSVEFLLSPVLLCYGVFLTEFALEDFYTLESAIWTVILFDSFWRITYPLTKSYFKFLNVYKEPINKRDLTLSTSMLFLALFATSLIYEPWSQVFLYGGFGGVLCSIISIQLRYYCNDAFEDQQGVYNITVLLAKPITLIFMPHLLSFLANHYGPAEAQLVFSAIILNILPICLLIRPGRSPPEIILKHRTFDSLPMELSTMNEPRYDPTRDDSSSDSGDEQGRDAETEIVIVEPHPEPQPRPETSARAYPPSPRLGVLPEIPEENEADEEDDINEITKKRLSRISAQLEEINATTQNPSVTNLYQPDETIEVLQDTPSSPEAPLPVQPPRIVVTEPPEIIEPSEMVEPSVFETNERCPRSWYKCSSPCLKDWKRQREQIRTLAIEFLWKPYPRAFGKITFYPVLVTKVTTTIISTVLFATTPYIPVLRSADQGKAMKTHDAAILLSVIAFTWLLFLLAHPVIQKMSRFKKRVAFLIGLALCGLGMYVSKDFTNNGLMGSCLLFGMGHGMILYNEDTVYENFVGRKHWYKMQWHLQTCTGQAVILVYLFIYFLSFDVRSLLALAFWPYAFNVCLWITVPIIKYIVVYLSRIKRNQPQRYMEEF